MRKITLVGKVDTTGDLFLYFLCGYRSDQMAMPHIYKFQRLLRLSFS